MRATTSPGEKLGSHVSVPSSLARDSLTRVQIFLGALIIQLISFIIFTYIFLRFVHRVRRFERDVWTLHHGCQWYNDWRSLAVALGISCVGIIVRPCFTRIWLLEPTADEQVI